MENALYHLENFEATLDVYEDRCVISAKKSFDAFMSGRSFAGAKEFYYADLTAVQYREARTLTAGYIQFEYPGSEGTGKKILMRAKIPSPSHLAKQQQKRARLCSILSVKK